MKILITGGCGFLGSNLAKHGIENDHDITLFDNLSKNGSYQNLLWLLSLGKINFIHGDIRNANDVEALISENSFYSFLK